MLTGRNYFTDTDTDTDTTSTKKRSSIKINYVSNYDYKK